MAFWKQAIGAVLVLCLIAAAAVVLLPGPRLYLEAQGLLAPAAAAPASSEPAAAKGANKAANAGGSGQSAGRPQRSSVVVLAPVSAAIANERVAALGVALAANSVTLVAAASGQLVVLQVKSGDKVHAGDVVAQLDSDAEQIAYDSAKVAADDARLTLQRNTQLNDTKLLIASQMQAFDLAAKMADLNLRGAELDLKNRTLIAPIDGTVGILLTSVGAEVTAQAPIASIVDDSHLTIRFAVPERMLGAIKPGDIVTLSPVSRPQDQFDGVVTALDNRVDSATGTFKVEATLPNPNGTLRDGMSFAVSLAFPGETFAAIPPLAVQWGSAGSYVWRVTDHLASRVDIRIVQRNSEAVLVAGALNAGDMVVTEGLDGLKDGAKVQVFGEPTPDLAASGAAPTAPQTPGQTSGQTATATATGDQPLPAQDKAHSKPGDKTAPATGTAGN